MQLYALAFLLGSFAVAALSDLKRMSAQREFLEVWLLAIAALLCYDAYRIYSGGDWVVPVVKWVIVLVASILSHHYVGIIFSLARGDVAACAAVAGLLSPLLIIIFYVVLKIYDLAMRPLLRIAGSGDAYPFMPVVFAGTISMGAIVIWVAPWIATVI